MNFQDWLTKPLPQGGSFPVEQPRAPIDDLEELYHQHLQAAETLGCSANLEALARDMGVSYIDDQKLPNSWGWVDMQHPCGPVAYLPPGLIGRWSLSYLLSGLMLFPDSANFSVPMKARLLPHENIIMVHSTDLLFSERALHQALRQDIVGCERLAHRFRVMPQHMLARLESLGL